MHETIKTDLLTGPDKIDGSQKIGGVYGGNVFLKREAAIGGQVEDFVRPDGSYCLLYGVSIAKIKVVLDKVGRYVGNSPPVCSPAGNDVNLMPHLQKPAGQACADKTGRACYQDTHR